MEIQTTTVVPLSNLNPWSAPQSTTTTTTTMTSTDTNENTDDIKGIKFPINQEINCKIYLWEGDLRFLDVDAIVNSTNESMNDTSGISGSILEIGGPELVEDISKCDSCRTGEARLTKSYNIPSRFIIHTVGPRYNDKYRTAAENALHNCYKNCLEVLKENKMHTIAFPVINSIKRGYPPEPGSHIAIRTIRRFLEHWGKDIEAVVLCMCNVEEYKIYSRVLPLYFPRNRKELLISKEELPRDTGNQFGETVIEERKIRISAFPGMTNADEAPRSIQSFNEPLSPTIATTSPGGGPPPLPPLPPQRLPNAFSMMKGDFDEERKKKLEQLSQSDRERIEQQQLYLSYLQKAQNTDLSDVARLNVIYETGKDPYGRPIIVVVGCRLPIQRVYLDRVFLYMIRTLDRIVEKPYVVVYIHTNMEEKDTPELSWMKQVYNIMDYKYGDHLVSFFVLHPTIWLKLFEGVLSKFLDNTSFFSKIRYMDKLDELYEAVDPEQLVFPEEVYRFDLQENGASSRQPVRRARRPSQAEKFVTDL